MKKFLALILSLIMVLSLVACGSTEATTAKTPVEPAAEKAPAANPVVESETKSGDGTLIKVGVLYPLSGPSASAGQASLWSVEWATDYINNELGGIQGLGGAKIELIVGDTKGDGEVALSEFERMVNVENVNVLLGLYNTAVANTLSQYCIANRVPCQVTNAVGYDAFSVDNEYVYHANGTTPTHTPYAVKFAEYQKGTLGCTLANVAYVYDSADYGRDAYETTLATKDLYGYGNLVDIPIEAGAADFSSQILKIKADPTIEWIEVTCNMDDAILFMRQMKEYQVALPIYAHGGGFNQADFVNQVGDAGNYMINGALWFTSQYKSAWDVDFAKKIVDQFQSEKGWAFDEAASMGWLGIWCLWDALERAEGTSRDEIAKAMSETDISGDHFATLLSGVKTVKYEDRVEENSGLMHYNQNFDTPNAFAMLMDGEYHTIFPENIAEPGFEFEWPVPSWDERG